jgi:uncharacterized membrane protein
MEAIVDFVLSYIIPIVEACGAVVIVLEVVRTFVQYLVHFVRRRDPHIRSLRTRLGQAMVTGLEFQVAADILRTATAPTWNDILLLAALIALRTVLNFLLEQELRTLSSDESEETA